VKVVLAIGDVGNGHRAAATALAQALKRRYGAQIGVIIEDFYQLVDPSPFGDSNAAQRHFARAPWLMRLTNDPLWHLGNTRVGYTLLERYLLAVSYHPYRQRLQAHKPDLVVSLHPYLSMVLSAIKRCEGGFRYAVVVTDLGTLLRGWADPAAELIISPSAEATRALRRYGAAAERIAGPLFPLSPQLELSYAPQAVRAALNLAPEQPTVLITGGGGGGRGLLHPIALLARHPSRQLIVVCGKDQALYHLLTRRYQTHPRVRILGFVDDLPRLMQASDVVIAKPGTTTILELLSLGKKVILTRDLGPQEQGNIRYALKRPNVRYIGSAWRQLPSTIDELLNLPDSAPAPHAGADADTIADALAHLLGLTAPGA
jgi:UDP-N-acetylglucosamine:LPS N-acetylglucosamine transferase